MNVFNDVVLLTGEVRDIAARVQIGGLRRMKRRVIHNEVVIGEIFPGMNRPNDSQISARVSCGAGRGEDPPRSTSWS